MIGKLSVISLIVSVTIAKHSLSYSFFEKEDKNKDQKLNQAQFLDGLRTAVTNSVIFK